MELPHVPRDLLEWLEKRYPIRMPKVDEPEREIFVRVGHREVVQTLINLYSQNQGRG